MQMTHPREAALAIPDEIVVRPRTGWSGLDLGAIWEYRDLLYFLLWRDLKVRYKQTALGVAWAVIQPVFTMVIFSVIFGGFAKLPSDGVPYPLFAYAGLLPWNLFAGVVNRSGTSLVSNANLISKVYFPRLLVPLSAALGALVDFAISLVVFFAMMVWFRQVPVAALVTVPVWSALALALGLAVGIALSALNVKYRDVSYLIGFMLQIWMYLSPVAYSASLVSSKWKLLYALNPMVGVIQGFRWALLGRVGELGLPWLPAAAVTLLSLAAAMIYFRKVERSFADVI